MKKEEKSYYVILHTHTHTHTHTYIYIYYISFLQFLTQTEEQKIGYFTLTLNLHSKVQAFFLHVSMLFFL